MFYEFSRTMDDEFTGYSDTAAWPSLFDEYVEWRRKQNGMESQSYFTNNRLTRSIVYICACVVLNFVSTL